MGPERDALEPFDPWVFSAYHALTLAHFHRGRYEAAGVPPTGPSNQISFSYMLLAKPLAKLGRLEEAKAAAARVLELQPACRYTQRFFGVDCALALAASPSEALHAIGQRE
jgi:hypothetical protein